MQNKKLTFDSPSLSISFSTSKSDNGRHYRCITESSSVSLENSANYGKNQQITFIPSHINTNSQKIQSKPLSMIQFSLNEDYPKSEVLPQQRVGLQPLDILVTSMNENDEENSLSMISMLSCTSQIVPSSFKYCNELNSYLVDNADCNQVLNVLNSILSNYNDDIDFKIDYDNKRIEGLVFISNYSVFFMIYIWTQNKENKNETRFEFRRQSGDALASAKFWAQIKGLYRQKTESKPMDNDNEFDFISLDLNLGQINIENNNNGHLSKSELNQLNESLINNDLFVVDELNYLYESLIENKNICYDILSDQHLMKQLINESLLNKDICVARIVLLILEELAKIKNHNMANNDHFQLFDNINLLLNHQRQLIKKYTIRLLSNLSNNSSKWNIDDISRNQMIQNIKKYENECTNNLSQEIIKINQKLLMK